MRWLGYVPALDGIRGVAIVLVLLAHLHAPLAGGGAGGVTMFFVLSGFLITWLLCEDLASGATGLRGFYRRRALRLLPALFAMIATVALIGVWDHGLLRSGEVVATLFYAENWVRVAGRPESPLSHAWSLSVEEQFYLLWPIVLVLLYRRRMLLFAVLMAAIWAGVLELMLTHVSANHAAFGTDTRGNALLIGCAASLLVFHSPTRIRVPRVLVAASVAVIVLWTFVATSFLAPLSVATAIVIVWIVEEERQPRLLCSWPVRQTGRISYGLYVWHWPLIWIVAPHLEGLPPLVRGVLLAVAVFAVAAASYRWIEKPFLRLKRPTRRLATVTAVAEAA